MSNTRFFFVSIPNCPENMETEQMQGCVNGDMCIDCPDENCPLSFVAEVKKP